MAEKNTLSILETIKKKMHKLDQKSEKTVAPASSNEEFQYISSAAKVEAAAVLEVKVPEQKIDTTFEDDLGLEDLGTEIAPPIPNTPPVAEASENKQPEALDDFNLDDFDLDSEAKTPAIVAPTAEVKQNEVGDFSEDDIEDFEDEIDIAEDEVVKEEVEEEHQDLVAGDVDWLGNKIVTDEVEEIPAVVTPKVDDLDLTFGEEAHEEVDETKHDELDLEHLEEEQIEETHEEEEDALDLEADEEKDDDLDLEHLDEEEHNEEEYEEEDVLDLEVDEEHKENKSVEDDDLDLEEENVEEHHEDENEEDILDLENHEEEPAPKEISEDDDLDFAELEKHEEKKPAMEIKEESHEDDDLNFDDLESLPPKKLEPQIHKDLDDDLDLELEMADKKLEAPKIQTPPFLAPKDTSADGIDLFDLEMKEKPISQTAPNNEIDLEFEKEIMGLKPASLPEKSVEDFISNPAPFQPQVAQQNYDSQSQISVMNSPKGTNNMGNGIYDSTLRQVGDSVRKLIDAKNVVSGISAFSQGPAFVELATHLMEPKLEKWLNEHLPDLVEQIVREEIKKIIPKD
jgi:hypothetical protein